MSDRDNVSNFNRAMDANRAGRTGVLRAGRNGQGELPISENPESREKRLREVCWWDAATWDEAAIEARDWVAAPLLMRRTVTALAGPGSGGKSSLMVAWALALALGRPFPPFRNSAAHSVLIYNVEDDDAEQKRRLSAALRHFDAAPGDLESRVIRCGPKDVGTLIEYDPGAGLYVLTPAWEVLEFLIEQFRPAVVILDPLVELHTAEENDNTALRSVLARFRVLATKANCALVLIHHTRKGAVAGDMEGIRGGSALSAACRIVLTVFPMTEEEAAAHGVVPKLRRSYFRLDPVKQNYAPQQEAQWFELREFELTNKSKDRVAAAVPWAPPSLMADMTAADCNRALDMIAAGPEPGMLFAPHRRGKPEDAFKRWAGRPLVEEFGLKEEQAARIVNAWVRTGLLAPEKYFDAAQRKDREGVKVVDTKRPTTNGYDATQHDGGSGP